MAKTTKKEYQYTFVFTSRDDLAIKHVIRADNKQAAICKLQSILKETIDGNIRQQFEIAVLETKYVRVNIDIKA